jgi:long-subunit acyl-CoA synthetase (AMP-forming)
MAAIFAGAVPGGIYATNSSEQCQYIAGHSQAKIVVVENDEQLEKFKQIRQNLPELKAIVMMKGSNDDPLVFAWDDLSELAQKISIQALDGCQPVCAINNRFYKLVCRESGSVGQ